MGLARDLAIQEWVPSLLIDTDDSIKGQNLTPRTGEHLGVGACRMRSVTSPIPHNYANGGWRVTEPLYRIIIMIGLTDQKLKTITPRPMSGFRNMRSKQCWGASACF